MLEQYAAQRPFRELDEAIGIAKDDWWMVDDRGTRFSFMKMWLDHVGDEAFKLAAEPKPEDFARMSFPMLTATGYFDDDQPGALRYYRRHVAHAPAAAASNHYLIIGPWDHFGTQHPTKKIEGLTIPDAAVIDMDKLRADWYDWVLDRGPRPVLLRDRVTYFMMGADRVAVREDAGGGILRQRTDLFLSAPEGTPKDLFHSGSLVRKPSEAEPPAVVISDPHELPELDVATYAKDENLTSQFRDFQQRAIVFHSAPFSENVEVAGQMRLNLVIQADAADFDLWAQVLMVLPDGSAVRLGEDIRRARFRERSFQRGAPAAVADRRDSV